MEPVPLDLPWDPYLQNTDLPEAKLLFSIILTAWVDANKTFNCPIKVEARDWFFSDMFSEFCDYLNLPESYIQEHLKKHWRLH